jgi:hypothetical protein
MGLYVHSLANIPDHTSRSHYVYILDYGWDEPLGETLRNNFGRISREAEEAGAAAIMGLDGIHFSDEIFSYHGINGVRGEEVLPAVLISTLNPSYFRESGVGGESKRADQEDILLLIPLDELCDTPSDVVALVVRIFKDIAADKKLSDFEVARRLSKSRESSLFDAVILEPNISGVGVDLRRLYATFKNKV